jgi:diguanylate cyclase (GGDEF)-like protein
MSRVARMTGGVPLEARLERISNIALGTAVATIALIIVALSFVMGMIAVIDSSRLQARALAENAAATLMFQDRGAARDLLQSAHHLPDVEVAALYDAQGTLFAQFAREGQGAPAVLAAEAVGTVDLRTMDLAVRQPVAFQRQVPGTLLLRIGLGGLYRQTAWLILGALFAVLVAMVPSRYLLRRLNSTLLHPVFDLIDVMRRVSRDADYSVRGAASDVTELNDLARGLNDMLGQIQDRDARLAIQREHLAQEVAHNAAILEAIPDLLFELDIEGRFIGYHSPRSDLLAAPPEAFLGKTVAQILPAAAAETCLTALRVAEADGVCTGKQIELPLAHGTFWFELSVSRQAATPGQPPHFIVLSRDITERRSAEERIRRLAYFDALTELPNRQSFLERVQREIARCQHHGGKLGILFMDLDGFKNINDTMGHDTGDLCLRLMADRLRDGLRSSDALFRAAAGISEIALARLGGDEFTVLLLGISEPGKVWAIANRLLELMRHPFVLGEREVQLTASIGIALHPEDGRDALELLKHADTAMYHAKAQGRDNCQFYGAALTEQAVRRMNRGNSLRHALDRGEFRLLYQPQFDLEQGRVVSVEALIRWEHPEEGTVAPLDFIPLAEENGLIVPIGEWVLRTACNEGAGWQRAGLPLRIAVNLSPMQFRSPNLLPAVRDALAQSGLPADMLELEITEGAVMQDDGQTLATLLALRDAGVRMALDDFGTGYSSMNYLKRMPLNNLKVDRSFVGGLPNNAEDKAIVRAILSMAKSLGFRVTAEGVETAEQARALTQMSCDALQGYFFSRPVPAIDIPALLKREWPVKGRAAAHAGRATG